MARISDYTSLAAAAPGDQLVIVDISDLTQSAQGTTKNITVANLQAAGLQVLTGGGTITATTISDAISAGFSGLYLDPRFVWDASGLVINGVQNFVIESRMMGSIGWGGHITYNTQGYIKTDTGSPADGVQIYASAPATNETQGVIFRNCVLAGANSRAIVHMGGGQRRCGFVDCLVRNTNDTAGAYAVIIDSGLSDNNSENNIFSFTGGGGLAGGYAALGIGITDQTQRANDTWYYGLVTAGDTYAIVKTGGGNHTFLEHYDRSSPVTATVWNHGGGRLMFIGGEDQNANGQSHIVDNANSLTVLVNRMITQLNPQTTTANVSAGSLILRGACGFNSAQTVTVSGTGTLDLSDPAIVANSATVSGSSGTLMLASNYGGSAPILTSWTGSITYQGTATVASNRATAQTGTVTLTFTPQPSGSARVRVSLHLRVTVAGTSTVVNLTMTQFGGISLNQNLPMMKIDGSSTAPVLSITTTGVYIFTGEFDTDSSGTAVVLTITPTGSTYTWSGVMERLT